MGNFRELLELQLVSQTTPLHVQLAVDRFSPILEHLSREKKCVRKGILRLSQISESVLKSLLRRIKSVVHLQTDIGSTEIDRIPLDVCSFLFPSFRSPRMTNRPGRSVPTPLYLHLPGRDVISSIMHYSRSI